ncbi:hypothetical protein FSARC_12306 [Fusarium sarcochroum]|uniref:Ankyrin repeat protein n=1 Tax=Fusarium sarcochroum TaxID=1208366 RepID=A0A8H4WXB3_9HYPO|nr:hypothetical protein FSARC_12306 [Fusarium sarcochroum]
MFPIQLAAKYGLEEVVECLLSYGAEPNTLGREQTLADSVLFQAAGCETSTLALVTRFLQAGARIPTDMNHQTLLLDEALRHHVNLDYGIHQPDANVPLFLLRQIPHVQVTDNRWITLLSLGASRNVYCDVDLLLSRGVDINHANHHGSSALIMAASAENDTMIEKLLAAGAEIDKTFGHRLKALEMAVWKRYESTVRLLLSKGETISKL